MRILLPPSEAKRPGGTGTPLARRTSTSVLAEPRARLIKAVQELTDPEEAARALALPPSVVAETVAANGAALTSRTLPAVERYLGTVYEGLAASTLSPAARTAAGREVLIFSGLFGVLRGNDPVPPYRVPAKAALPGIGIVATWWKPILADAIPALLGGGSGGLIIDLRSTDYAAMWSPAGPLADRLVKVRILSVKPDGTRGVISYSSKLGKGKLARALLEHEAAGSRVGDVEGIAECWRTAGGTNAVVTAVRHGWTMDLLD